MPLSLGVKKGSKIKVDQSMVEVVDVVSLSEIRINVSNGMLRQIKQHTITNEERTEILPEVFVSAGRDDGADHSTKGYTRLAFEAPRRIKINRVPNQ